MGWEYLAVALVLMVISYLITPKTKSGDAQANALEDKDFPIAQEAEPIPVIFGEVVLKQPNVVWWGDTQVRAIHAKASKGI